MIFWFNFADIDECNVGLDDCSRVEKCINTLGSYVCQPRVHCSAGFGPDPVTGECKGKVLILLR